MTVQVDKVIEQALMPMTTAFGNFVRVFWKNIVDITRKKRM